MAVKIIVSGMLVLLTGFMFYKSWFDAENLRRELLAHQEARTRLTFFKIIIMRYLQHPSWVWMQRLLAVGLVGVTLWVLSKIWFGV